MNAERLRLEGVSRRFQGSAGVPGVAALTDVSLSLAAGRKLALLGPDASGKTTLLRICAGLMNPNAGKVAVLGGPVARLDRGLVGYMPQGGALYAELSVAQNLRLYARLRGLARQEEDARLAHLLALTGLSAFTRRAAGRLSGGMRQKLALACAVAAAPPLMLLDEPSVGVDPVSRRQIWQLAGELAGPETAIVWATSIVDEAERCDDVLVLHHGVVRYAGDPAGLARFADGRCWSARVAPDDRRALLQGALGQPQVAAGNLVGERVRLTLRSPAGAPPQIAAVVEPWQAQPARADDGFALLLDDGSVLAASAIAAAFPQRPSGPGEPPAIEALALTKRYGAFTAAHDVTFAVRPGEIFGLLGPNGAGKSTTFRMLCGLARPSAGQGRVAGLDFTTAAAEARQALGYMPQRFSLYGDLTVAANLRFVAGAYGMRGGAADAAIAIVVESLGLAPFWGQAGAALPLGIKQRLSLAAAVMHAPRVLFLDEPTSGVDPLIRRELWHHINAIAARGVAVLVTTHFMDEAQNCDRLLLIDRAETIAQGTPDRIRAWGGTPQASLEEAFIALVADARRPAQAA